jgi:hypothetical protein
MGKCHLGQKKSIFRGSFAAPPLNANMPPQLNNTCNDVYYKILEYFKLDGQQGHDINREVVVADLYFARPALKWSSEIGRAIEWHYQEVGNLCLSASQIRTQIEFPANTGSSKTLF